MNRKHHFRPFTFINSIILLLLLVSLLAKAGNVYSDEELYAWVEMGDGSATNWGISDNSGGSHSPSLVIGPDGTPIIA